MSEPTRTRAVSEVLGYILIFSMVLMAIAFVSVSGFASLENARDTEQNNNAQRAFDVLSNNIEDVYRRGAPSRATELSLGGAQLYVDDPVTMRVFVDGSQEVETSLRPLVFQARDGVEFVYEAGAVFRTQRDGGFVVRNPPLRLNDDRMIFSVVRTKSPHVQSIGGPAVLVRTGARGREVAVRTSSDPDVTIEIDGSPRQDLWQRYFEDELQMDCTVPGGTLHCETDGIDPDSALVTVTSLNVELET